MGAGPLRTALAQPELRARLDEPFHETEHGDTLLSLAARHDNTEAARFLVQEGANPDAPTKDGATSPLFIAVHGGHDKIAKLLLDAKADATRAAADGRTPILVAAARKGGEESIKMLLAAIPKGKAAAAVDECPADGGITALLKASFLGYDETVRQLLKAGANASHADSDGEATAPPLILTRPPTHTRDCVPTPLGSR